MAHKEEVGAANGFSKVIHVIWLIEGDIEANKHRWLRDGSFIVTVVKVAPTTEETIPIVDL